MPGLRAIVAGLVALATADELARFGHDDFSLPSWIHAQIDACTCAVQASGARPSCVESGLPCNWRNATELTFCVAKSYLLERMPAFDLQFLPPSVTVNGSSMLDDNCAFALMARKQFAFAARVPIPLYLAYVLPYASYHEARSNWRPLLFAKLQSLVNSSFAGDENATTADAVAAIVAPNRFLNWSGNVWPASPREAEEDGWRIQWASSTAPPVVAPFDFVAYGYGSCSAWATFITYSLRAIGVPARQSGTPCWNSVYSGTDYRGLALDNANVSLCWHGGDGQTTGGGFLNKCVRLPSVSFWVRARLIASLSRAPQP